MATISTTPKRTRTRKDAGADEQGAPTPQTFDSLNPATGDVVGTYPVMTREEVDATVERARIASQWWTEIGFDGRKEVLGRWNGVITRRIHQLADVVHAETGKPHGDAVLEIGLAIDHIAWAAGHAKKVLGRRTVSPGLLMVNQKATIEYKPRGVVGVIGPWNYPVFTPMGSLAYALAAGNTVVFKPSEYTPGVGTWLVDAFAEVVSDYPVLQLVTGLGETGAALASAKVDKVAFTGSPATGRKVMTAAAENLTPVVIEGGGKDALIVDEDADIAAAADAALWGGMSNAGQTCIGTERVYVHEKVFDAFVSEITAQAAKVRAGSDADAEYGPITMPSQVPIIKRHVEDAVARGGRAVVGGPDAVGERFVQPTILVDVPEDADAVTEETFGPTLVVNPVPSMDEAVRRANATSYGLGGAVFGKKRAAEIAHKIRAGMTSVNSVTSFAGVPSLPFGGVGESGFGRIHGEDGLKEFAYSHAVTVPRFKPAMVLTTFGRTPGQEKSFVSLLTALHGGKALRVTKK
ncbi:aldehyde dehydrogenase family protein [Mumia sp. zg.B17]|uniref:aldehyde dehydrogenase family protein n=1 Tax=unclassified Mumia TaxID=2621872 RepID=UPI001C6ECF11|nr:MULTISPECIES: aldehyde dehydrogenase family protein [unclassified Mumia]MBW9204589.1 aldehyde dehydrogenase family protein [Mumia sp. zg.B17]MBW9209406.1 aldehyde dehydrogenase family protein [Mumia sp. zg.B21]